MIRKRCVRRGHKWGSPARPHQFCRRMLCDGIRVNPNYPMADEVRALMEQLVLGHMAALLKEETR